MSSSDNEEIINLMSTEDEDEDEELGEQQEIEIDISSNDNEDEDKDEEFGELGVGTNRRDRESSVEEEKMEELPANSEVNANDYNVLRARENRGFASEHTTNTTTNEYINDEYDFGNTGILPSVSRTGNK